MKNHQILSRDRGRARRPPPRPVAPRRARRGLGAADCPVHRRRARGGVAHDDVVDVAVDDYIKSVRLRFPVFVIRDSIIKSLC